MEVTTTQNIDDASSLPHATHNFPPRGPTSHIPRLAPLPTPRSKHLSGLKHPLKGLKITVCLARSPRHSTPPPGRRVWVLKLWKQDDGPEHSAEPLTTYMSHLLATSSPARAILYDIICYWPNPKGIILDGRLVDSQGVEREDIYLFPLERFISDNMDDGSTISVSLFNICVSLSIPV